MSSTRNPFPSAVKLSPLVVKTLFSIVRAASPVCVMAAILLSLSGCGSEDGTSRADAPAVTRDKLVAGDMMEVIQSLLIASGEDQPDDYVLTWANFVAGPTIIAAATGGSVDISWMMETPLVFAQAAGSPVKVIAASVPIVSGGGSIAVAVAADSPVQSFADLKDKKVFHMPGTILQYVLLEHLKHEGLGMKDIQTVTTTTGTGAGQQMLINGTVDAAVLVEPAITLAEQNPNIRFLPTTLEKLHAATRLVVVPTKILEDESAHPLIADFLTRLNRAYQWQQDNFDEAEKHQASVYKVPVEQAGSLLRRSLSHFVPIDDEIIASLQNQADTFTEIGVIRKSLDMNQIFDKRFNYLFEAGSEEQIGSLSQDDISN